MLHGRTEMTSKKRLLALGLGALLVGIASTATAEEGFRPDSSKEKLPCPHPSEVTLILRKLFVEPKDFPGAAPPVLADVNDSSSNKPFRHTFTWTEPKEFCCEILSARLK